MDGSYRIIETVIIASTCSSFVAIRLIIILLLPSSTVASLRDIPRANRARPTLISRFRIRIQRGGYGEFFTTLIFFFFCIRHTETITGSDSKQISQVYLSYYNVQPIYYYCIDDCYFAFFFFMVFSTYFSIDHTA